MKGQLAVRKSVNFRRLKKKDFENDIYIRDYRHSIGLDAVELISFGCNHFLGYGAPDIGFFSFFFFFCWAICPRFSLIKWLGCIYISLRHGSRRGEEENPSLFLLLSIRG